MGKLSDSEIEALVSRYAVGSKSGWHYLLTVAERNACIILKNREDAEDIAQEAMIKLCNDLKSGAEIKNPAGFVYFTAKFKSLDLLKKKDPLRNRLSKEKPIEEEEAAIDAVQGLSNGITIEIACKEVFAILTRCLNRVEPPCPKLLRKHFLEDHPYTALAEKLNIPADQARVKGSRCLQKLKQTLKDHSPSFFVEVSDIGIFGTL